MKIITNKFFKEFCDVIKGSLLDSSKYKDCLSDLITSSEDDKTHIKVYEDEKYNIQVIKLDEYTKDFNKKRRKEMTDLKVDHTPKAVDAVCINNCNQWFLIEFKNQPLDRAIEDSSKKMHSSLWLIGFLYSALSKSLSDEKDLVKFARENITYILVVSSAKNEEYEGAIGATWTEEDSHYTPQKLLKYKGYYFKDIYIITEKGLRFFAQGFAE